MSGDKVIRIRRVYGGTESGDGSRVLVDRLWPRGLSKASANLDLWLNTIAPSEELRRWYRHDPKRYVEFARRYRGELSDDIHREAIAEISDMATHGPVTLLTATKDVGASHVPILLDELNNERRLPSLLYSLLWSRHRFATLNLSSSRLHSANVLRLGLPSLRSPGVPRAAECP